MANISGQVQNTTKVMISFVSLAVAGLVLLLVLGNLSGNLGFDALSQGANDSDNIINNITGGAVTFFSFAGVWFTLIAVVFLIIIVMGVLSAVQKGGGGSFSS